MYTVIVSNIGTVYNGYDYADAKGLYDDYVELSKLSHTRACGEEVLLCLDDEPIEEHPAVTELDLEEQA
jgi:hypothetical protein